MRNFLYTSDRLDIRQRIVGCVFRYSYNTTQRAVEIRPVAFKLWGHVSIVKLILRLLLFQLPLGEHLLLRICCQLYILLFQNWLLLGCEIFLSFALDKNELFVDAEVLHDVLGLETPDLRLPVLKKRVVTLVFNQIHREQFIVKLHHQ